MNTDGESLSGVTFVMSADIDLGGSEWTPIGTSSTDYYFSGNFDGGGYEFQNYVPSTSHTYSGIFGVVSATDSDESVKIANVSVSGTGSLKSTGGGIVGLARGSGTVTIDSCVSDVDIAYSGSGTVRFGGIVGYCSASAGTLVIQNCVNYGSISCSGSGQLYAGGIIGRASGGTTTIINCANFGAITSSATTTCYLAGISAAITTNGKITVSQCVNAGAISAAAGTPYALANTDGATSATVQYSFYLSGCASSVTNAATTSNCSAFTVSEGQNHIATAVSYGTASYGTDSSATVILNAIAADSTDLLSWENVSDSSSNFYGCPRLVGL